MYKKFSELLQNRQLSTYRVSKDTGISQQTFSDWKAGRSTPKIDKLQKIADYFGVSIDYFIGEENEDKKSTPPEDERSATVEFVKSLSDTDFDRLESVIKAVFPDKFKE